MRGRIIALVRATRHLPTLELFSACWRAFLQELEDAKESQARTYLVKEYIQTHKVENVKKFYGLRQTILADVWAAYWCGTLGTHPGSGTGSQTLEGFHRLWQFVLTKSTRQRRPCSPSTGLRICRTTTPQARHYGPGRRSLSVGSPQR